MRASRILAALLLAVAAGASAAYADPPGPPPRGPGHGCGHGHGNQGSCGQGDHGNGHGNGGCGHSHGQGNTCGGTGGGGGGGDTGGAGGTTGGPAGGPGATAPTGTAGTGVLGATAADTLAPSFLAIPRLHPRRFRAARRGGSIAARTGTTITYTLSEPARVTFTVQKYRHLSRICRRRLAARNARHRTGTRCRRWISLRGRFAKASTAGPNSVRFTGRLRRRKLRPGAYRLVVRARDASGNVTPPRRPNFRIVR